MADVQTEGSVERPLVFDGEAAGVAVPPKIPQDRRQIDLARTELAELPVAIAFQVHVSDEAVEMRNRLEPRDAAMLEIDGVEDQSRIRAVDFLDHFAAHARVRRG